MKAKVYTKNGDRGETSLVGGTRVSKAHFRLEAYGTVDELNSVLGLIAAEAESFKGGKFGDEVARRLKSLQNNLFNAGSRLACEDKNLYDKLPGLHVELVSQLETDMDLWESELSALRNFILPGGTALAAKAHLARTICRRTERHVVRMQSEMQVDGDIVVFLNRLSDWLFLLARKFNHVAGIKDVEWSKN